MRWGRLLLLSALLPAACKAPGGGNASASGGRGAGSPSGSDEVPVRVDLRKDAQAQYDFGLRYFYGQGVPRDEAQGLQWFRKAAEQGNAGAQTFLAMAYRDGRGVTLDFGQAASWARKAAEQGHARGQGLLGIMSFDGQGVPRDAVEGYKWETLAAARATEDDTKKFASNALGIMAKAMTAEQIAMAETRAQAWVSARRMTEDLVREMALRTFCGAGPGPFFIEVDGGPPSPTLLGQLRGDPRYRSIVLAKAEKQNPFGVPERGAVVNIGPIEWQTDRKALLRLSTFKGPLDAFAEQLLVERDAAGQWSVRVVPGSQVVS
jgi:hypothetical protein